MSADPLSLSCSKVVRKAQKMRRATALCALLGCAAGLSEQYVLGNGPLLWKSFKDTHRKEYHPSEESKRYEIFVLLKGPLVVEFPNLVGRRVVLPGVGSLLCQASCGRAL